MLDIELFFRDGSSARAMTLDSQSRALIFEEHSSVLPHWWRVGLRARTVVYLDAHLDLQYVSADRIGRLEQCRTAEQVAALEKPHDLCPDGGFSYGIENFLYPAARLGLVGRLIWVAPPHVTSGYADRAVAQLRQMDGVQPEDLASFRRVDGRIEGRLLGLDVALCDFRALERLAVPPDCAIDIDVDYFVRVPGDAPWIDPRIVVDALRGLARARSEITISRSVSSGFTPLRHRFLGDYVAALWEQRTDDAEHYARLFELDRRLRAGERDAAARALGEETARRPDCAATWFLMGLAQADPADAEHCRARAAQISPAYAPSVLREACGIRHRRLAIDRAHLMRLERELARLAPAEQGLGYAAMGLLYSAFGDLHGALGCYRGASTSLGTQGQLALEIGTLLLRAGRPDEALPFLRVASEDDKDRSVALGYLADVLRGSGELEAALVHLEHAHGAAPCWDVPLQQLAALYGELGAPAQAQECSGRLVALRAQQEAMRRRLSS
jgi:tetratricopeptide (TPR) repeat protein